MRLTLSRVVVLLWNPKGRRNNSKYKFLLISIVINHLGLRRQREKDDGFKNRDEKKHNETKTRIETKYCVGSENKYSLQVGLASRMMASCLSSLYLRCFWIIGGGLRRRAGLCWRRRGGVTSRRSDMREVTPQYVLFLQKLAGNLLPLLRRRQRRRRHRCQ